MNDVIHLCRPTLPAPDQREILRYMGMRGEDKKIEALVDSCLGMCEGLIDVRACYRECGMSIFENIDSRSLRKHIEGCESAVLFAVTLGIGIDRLISKYSRLEPSRALCFQAIGAERIEAACESIEDILKQNGYRATRTRFSPGYGDLPLEFQRDIFALLDCERKIGITLNESLLVSPSKSVTAIVGIER